MKSRFPKSLIVAAGMVSLAFGAAFAQDMQATQQDSIMAEYMKYAMPGKPHTILDPLIGKWDLVTRYRQAPDAPEQESKATSVNTWILGGRYVQEEVTGEMLGMPFHGISMTGYDLMKNEYLNIWMDEMSTAPMISYGQIDPTGKIITFEGTYPDIMQDMKEVKYRTIIKLVSSNEHVMEMYMVDDKGGEFKNMEITYTRAK